MNWMGFADTKGHSLATCTKEMLEAIGRNTALLLQVANQMKRVIQAMEAMPRQLDVDIIRLDDALGETWGLPLQACVSWDVSFQASRVCGPSFC